ncbi:MAG: hypothetical protein ACREQA_19720 [Candidatus Binatia bacterium]
MAKYAKFIVALLTAASVMASSGMLPPEYSMWVNAVVAAVGAGLVYLVPNVKDKDNDGTYATGADS